MTAATADTTSILSLLRRAKDSLLWPKIRYTTVHGVELKLTLSKKYADSVSVVCNGDFAGYIRGNKIIWITERIYKETRDELQALLDAPDIIKELSVHGQKFGYCCFCNRDLMNASSIFHGYGPICAEKFGLPWGDTGEPSPATIKEVSPDDI